MPNCLNIRFFLFFLLKFLYAPLSFLLFPYPSHAYLFFHVLLLINCLFVDVIPVRECLRFLDTQTPRNTAWVPSPTITCITLTPFFPSIFL
ncbi:hypothetical protein BJV82DRAFT_399272 [Fennellomyces sp. T-0311]|nr:hypothetical protein BJV82DRAFT_399272 [Fennellomyces sp. T-0311]